jgi:3-(methylthio)propionyl---CoA ligase
MFGQMMQQPLLIADMLQHAARHHADAEIVSRSVEGPIVRHTWHGLHERAKQLAKVLLAMGVKPGDRIATLAWNTHRHLEIYYAVSGIGAICHTINPRLHPEQIGWIANDAADSMLFFDTTFTPLVEAAFPHMQTVKHLIAMTDEAHKPNLTNVSCYETHLASQTAEFTWPTFDENTASSLCYTSGTTGNPKGALYSHRSSTLHAMALCQPDAMCLSSRDCMLPIVPMFHVNAWGIPYGAALTGCKLVMPGPKLDGASVYELLESEQVTISAAVPTVWLLLLNHLKTNNLKFSTFKRTVIGGSACPPAMMKTYKEDYGVDVLHAWGMTEMSPLGTVSTHKAKHLSQSKDAQQRILEKQGHALFGVDMKVVNDAGTELPWDGSTYGNLMVRGHWVIESYFKGAGADNFVDGWFHTGDVATIDADGYMQITDRSKDVIKSGGEWISTIDLENLAMAHPKVLQAAVIGLPHAKWDERPLLILVPKPGETPTREEMQAYYDGKIAKFWMPDDIALVEALPLGATGKILKTKLREQFKNHVLPTA